MSGQLEGGAEVVVGGAEVVEGGGTEDEEGGAVEDGAQVEIVPWLHCSFWRSMAARASSMPQPRTQGLTSFTYASLQTQAPSHCPAQPVLTRLFSRQVRTHGVMSSTLGGSVPFCGGVWLYVRDCPDCLGECHNAEREGRELHFSFLSSVVVFK